MESNSLNSSLFKSLYQNISDSVAIVDENIKIIYCNDSFNDLYNLGIGDEIVIFEFNKYVSEIFQGNAKAKKILHKQYVNDLVTTISYIEGFAEYYVLILSKETQPISFESEVNESLARASSELISPSLSIDTIARIVFKACIELTQSETGFVAFDDPMSENILLHYFTESYVVGKELSGNIQFIDRDDYLQKGLYGHQMNANTPVFKNDLELSLNKNIGKNNPSVIRNYLTYPAIVDNIFMGQIVLLNCPGGFTKNHVEVLCSLSNVYGLAIFRKRMEWDLVSAKEKAEESDRLKTAFLANMSHEIRTPMNAIVGFSQLITSSDLNENKRVEFSKLINSSCEDLLKLVTEIIDLSKIEAKQMVLYPDTFVLEKVLQEQIEITKVKAESLSKNLIIEFISNDPLLKITADQSRLGQILRNLLDNALKFTDQGSIKLVYRLIESNLIEISVKDTGIGIPYEKQKRVFESFRQLEVAMKRNYGGTGLGLSIVKNLAELMGGGISLKSEPSNGSEFHITLPLHKYPSVNPPRNGTAKKVSIASIRSKNILIVEDEPRNAKFLELLLVGERAKTKIMYNGKQAVEWVKGNKPDLILMDIRMPVMDGLEATKQIRKIMPTVPIIAQTAYAMKEDENLCMEAGCNAFVSKPIKRDQLLQLISDQLLK